MDLNTTSHRDKDDNRNKEYIPAVLKNDPQELGERQGMARQNMHRSSDVRPYENQTSVTSTMLESAEVAINISVHLERPLIGNILSLLENIFSLIKINCF